VLGGYVDAIVCRSKSHDTIRQLAEVAGVPVINGLSDLAHPCQALADVYALRQELGRVQGLSLAFVGDGNNVARSLAVVCGLLGMRFVLAAPEAYQFDAAFRAHLATILPGAEIEETTDPAAAVKGAAAVYTDVWASMGQERERAERQRAFAPYQVNEALMARCPDAVFMHCLPARRGEEVTDGVIDGPRSIVLPQAAARMHLQKGLLAWLLGHTE
jgi:ornithine carbamoyltransferase